MIERRKRRTDEDLVSQERRPVNLCGVHLDEAPVLGVAVGFGRDLDRLRVIHPADTAQLRGGAVLCDLGVEGVQLVDGPRGLVHLVGVLLALRGQLGVIGRQPAERVLPDVDVTLELANVGHYVRDDHVVAPGTERNEVLAVPARVRARHARVVGEGWRRAGDVGARQQHNVIGGTAEVEVEPTRALVVGGFQRRDGQAEGRGEVLSVLGDGVYEWVERHELGASSGTRDDGLDKGHLNLGEAGRGEDQLDTVGSGNSVLAGEGMRVHTDREYERAEGVGFPFVGVTEGVDRCPIYPHGVEALVDELEDRKPSGPNVGTVDRTRLTDDSLLLRASTNLPGRTRLVNTWSAARVEIAPGLGVLVGEATCGRCPWSTHRYQSLRARACRESRCQSGKRASRQGRGDPGCRTS